MRRPLVWILAFYILIILIYRAIFYEEYSARYFVLSGYDENVSRTVTGTVYQTARRDREEEHWLIVLKDVTVHLSDGENRELRYLPVYWEGTEIPSPGNRVGVTGNISPVSRASNPGQFDFAAYYAQKDIYYLMFGTRIKIQSQHTYPVKAGLYRLRSAMNHVYESVLSDKDAGILSAMILGDRSSLDLEQKEEYQKNGIGHILAISGVKTLKLDIPLVPETRINWAFVPLHIAIIYILKLCLDEEIIPRCRFPCSRGYLTKCINWQKKQ